MTTTKRARIIGATIAAGIALTVTASASTAAASNGNGNRLQCVQPEIDTYAHYDANGAPTQTQVIVYCHSVTR